MNDKPAAGAAASRRKGATAPADSQRESAKAERRARIVQAARELMQETGDAGLSMRALAQRAGVSQATPYNLFGSKRAILVAVLEDIRGFGKLFTGAARLSPLEQVLQAVALAVSYYEKAPAFYRVVWKTILGSEASEDRQALFNPKRDAFWRELLQSARSAGLLRPEIEVDSLMRSLDSVFRGVMLEWVLGDLTVADLQPRVGYAYVLALRGAASAEGQALLEAPLLRWQSQLAAGNNTAADKVTGKATNKAAAAPLP